MKDRFRVLIINSCHWPLLARLPFLLHRAGCEVDLFAPKGVLVGQSRYLKQHYVAPAEINGFIGMLETHLAEQPPYDWVICGDDPLMYSLAKLLAQPWVQAIYPSRLDNQIPIFLLSKSAFPIMGKRWGLPVPHTRTGDNVQHALQLAEEMGYPLLIKRHLGFSGESIRKVASPAELREATEDFNLTQTIILQEIVPGETCCGVALYKHGELRAWMAFRNVRNFPEPMGPAAEIQVLDLPELEPILEKVGEVSGYHGLGGVDFILGPDGQITLLEQHARPPQIFYLSPNDGSVDFGRAIGRMLRDEPVEMPRFVTPRHTVTRPLFPKDLRRAILEGDWLRAARWLLNPAWWPDVPWHEPAVAAEYAVALRRTLHKKLFGEPHAVRSNASKPMPGAKPVSEAPTSVHP